ncbi:MAG: MaoC family dehydratase N-terminal domain-containing protein [Pseudomonadota bacterium]
MDQVNLGAWEGRTDVACGAISAEMAAMWHATLGDPRTDAPRAGDALPPLSHWCAFPPEAHMSELQADGHPAVGSFLPSVHLKRRMWAGGTLRFGRPLHVGEPLERRSRVRSIKAKDGRAGPMVFVTVDHAIYGAQGLAVTEQQDIVYLEIPDSFTPPKKMPMPDAPVAQRRVDPTETLLFRYSALTFNAHRIHYDLPYAQEVEHYPGLVVHGPLQATLLMQLAVSTYGSTPDQFHFRGVHPLFAGAPMDVVAVEDSAGLLLFSGAEGHQGMQAGAIWEGTQ